MILNEIKSCDSHVTSVIEKSAPPAQTTNKKMTLIVKKNNRSKVKCNDFIHVKHEQRSGHC